MDGRWSHRVYENLTMVQYVKIYILTFLKYVKGTKFSKIQGHKYDVKFDYIRFFIIVLGLISLIGIFSRNIHKSDIFEEDKKEISASGLSISLFLLLGWVPFAIFMSILFLMG